MELVYSIIPEGQRDTPDGRKAYAVALRQESGWVTPLCEEACADLDQLWGVTNWSVGHTITSGRRAYDVTRELLWVDSSTKPHRLYSGYAPKDGRVADETPKRLGTNIVFKRVAR